MQTADIRRAVLEAIAAIAPETDVDSLRPDAPLREQIELDSLDWLNVIAGLEERLAIEIPESDHGRLTTLDAIVAYAATRAAAPRASATPPAEPRPMRVVIDGTPVELRPLRADDLPREAEFVRHLSPDARYQRFMVTLNELPESKLHYLTEVDQVRHVALAATVQTDGAQRLIGVARYVVDDAGSGCEFAIAIDDAWQRTGLAGILMHALIGLARARGLATMEGLVLASNTRMLKFTRQLGFKPQRDAEDRGTVRVVRAL